MGQIVRANSDIIIITRGGRGRGGEGSDGRGGEVEEEEEEEEKEEEEEDNSHRRTAIKLCKGTCY